MNTLLWAVRREVWENRSIYIGPIVVAALIFVAYAFSTITLPRRLGAAADPASQQAIISMPFDAAAGVPLAAAFLVGVFYCLDALYGDRRDRSVLFWKSLPVSDTTTVLSKACIPLVVLPLIVFATVMATQWLMLLLGTSVLMMSGVGPGVLWREVRLLERVVAMAYAVVAAALWHAPIYGWLLLVSAWARRAPFLWAALPPLAVAAFERIAIGTSHVGGLLGYRLGGWLPRAFVMDRDHQIGSGPIAHMTPAKFASTPALWAGLAFAALFIAGAVRLRRGQESELSA